MNRSEMPEIPHVPPREYEAVLWGILNLNIAVSGSRYRWTGDEGSARIFRGQEWLVELSSFEGLRSTCAYTVLGRFFSAERKPPVKGSVKKLKKGVHVVHIANNKNRNRETQAVQLILTTAGHWLPYHHTQDDKKEGISPSWRCPAYLLKDGRVVFPIPPMVRQSNRSEETMEEKWARENTPREAPWEIEQFKPNGMESPPLSDGGLAYVRHIVRTKLPGGKVIISGVDAHGKEKVRFEEEAP